MKNLYSLIFPIVLFILFSCGGEKENKEKLKLKLGEPQTEVKTTEKKEGIAPSKRIDLTTKGVGPISSITLDSKIDQQLVARGEQLFKSMCAVCHRTDKKFMGPALQGMLDRRTPEWVMNIMLNPEEMLKKEPLAQDLLKEFNNAPMLNQHVSEDDARALLEFIRSL